MCKVAFSGRKRHSAVSILQSAEANPLGRKEHTATREWSRQVEGKI